MSSTEIDNLSLSESESPQIPTSLTNESTTSLSYTAPMQLPQPPENPANTVPSKTLWMGDVESWWDEDFVANLWSQLNKRVSVKVIKPKSNLLKYQLAKSNEANHSGYCFIEFETPNDAQDALSLNGTNIPGQGNKTFRLNWASGATLDSEVAQTPEYSLFVGDLSPVTTEAHLLALFQTHFNSIKTVRVMTNPATGLSRCFGFVRFSNEDDRQKALLDMNGKWLGGRQIRVALATPKHQNVNGFNKVQNSHSDQPPMSMDSNDMFHGPPLGYYPFNNQNNDQVFNDPNNTTVFIGGLANGINDDTLATLFEPFGEIVNIKIPQGKGCGFVRFVDRKSAESAIQNMQGFVIAGSRIRLSWGRSNNRMNMRRPQQQHQIPPMSGMFDYQQQMMNGPPLSGQIPSAGNSNPALVNIPPPYIYDPYFASNIPSSIPNMDGTGINRSQPFPPGLVMEGGLDQMNMSPQQFPPPLDKGYMYLPPQNFPNVMGNFQNYEQQQLYHQQQQQQHVQQQQSDDVNNDNNNGDNEN